MKAQRRKQGNRVPQPSSLPGAPAQPTRNTVGSTARYLIVDGHSIIFAWPELRKLHDRRTALAREALAKQLREYQDWTGVRVVLVFDGQGSIVSTEKDPYDIQIFYSRKGQTADAVVERLASRYAGEYDVTVATSDLLERQTVTSFGAVSVSPEMLREMLEESDGRGMSRPPNK